MPDRINNSGPRPVTRPSTNTPAPAAERRDDRLIPSVNGGLVGTSKAVDDALAGIEARNGAIGTLTRQTFDALVAQVRKSNPNMSVADAQFQRLYFLNEVHAAVVDNKPSGALIRTLRSYSSDAAWGVDVSRYAKKLADALKPMTSSIAVLASTANGPFKLPITLELDGRSVKAELVGTMNNQSLDKARVSVNGRELKLTDGALSEALARAGLGWDAENSSQTEVVSRGILGSLLGRTPEFVTFDGEKFRMLKKEDLNGGWVYFHAGDIKVEG